jgi:hypothetical protein
LEVKVGSRIGGVPNGSFSFKFQFQLQIASCVLKPKLILKLYIIWITSCGLAARISWTRSFTRCVKV